MDSITQGLLGAAIAEAGFRRRLGGRAVAWGALCGVAPDFDLVAAIAGEWQTLIHHRGVTHSLVALTIATPFLGLLAHRFVAKGQGTRLDWMHLTFWALITHPLLDWCTAYGTQLFFPITDARYAIDAVSIIDLAYSIPLLFAVIAARRMRDRKKSARFAAAMLAVTTAYLAFGYAQSQRALAWADEELTRDGFVIADARAMPTLFNVFVFRVVARDPEGTIRASMVSVSAPRALRWYELRSDEDPLVDEALRSERGHIFTWFAMGMVHSDLRHEDDGFTVHMSDARYGSVRDPRLALWGADARFDSRGQLIDVVRWQRERDQLDMRAELAETWAHLVGDVSE